ncbi:hypothetical protein M422DRAFT_215883, partial [Sphaerobolus stellatus SS14]
MELLSSTTPYSSLQFQSATDDFLRAVVAGPKALEEFSQKWSALQKGFSLATAESKLTQQTISMAAVTANDISILGQSFVDLQVQASSIEASLRAESEAILSNFFGSDSKKPNSRLSKPSLQSPRHPTSTPISNALANMLPQENGRGTISMTESAQSSSDPNPLPEFIEHAYKFFVANIFNPYPTREEKQAIVDQSNTGRVTVNSLTNWFTNARRRCGWADILKRRCDGDREEMVDLAKRVFVQPDPKRPVDERVIAEFMEMKENAESMYERNTRVSSWIDELDD